jgi:hypothetical protein
MQKVVSSSLITRSSWKAPPSAGLSSRYDRFRVAEPAPFRIPVAPARGDPDRHATCRAITNPQRRSTAVSERRAKPQIEILSFEGCPNREHAIQLVSETLAAAGADADVRVIDVPDAESAERTRFLGSPTIRVDGRDIEPGADERNDFVRSCRVFRTERGLTGEPDPRWLREALAAAVGGPA